MAASELSDSSAAVRRLGGSSEDSSDVLSASSAATTSGENRVRLPASLFEFDDPSKETVPFLVGEALLEDLSIGVSAGRDVASCRGEVGLGEVFGDGVRRCEPGACKAVC